MTKYLNFLLIFIPFWVVFGEVGVHERADAFIIEALPDRYKILAPVSIQTKIGIILKNNTLSKLIGKIETNAGTKRVFLSVPSGSYKSIDVEMAKGETFYFIPLSPSFERIELKVGQLAYEIPEKKKN